MALVHYDWCPIRKGGWDTDMGRERPWRKEGENGHLNAEKRGWGEIKPTDTLTLDFYPPGWWEETRLSLSPQSVMFCYNSPSKPTHSSYKRGELRGEEYNDSPQRVALAGSGASSPDWEAISRAASPPPRPRPRCQQNMTQGNKQ